MPQKSSIKTLPREILERLNFLLSEGALTLDAITAWLDDAGHPRSRSAVGRYKLQLDAVGEEMQRSRAIAEALVQRFGAEPDNRLARLNFELMHSMVMKILVNEEGGVVTLGPEEAMFIGRTLRDLTTAAKTDADRYTKEIELAKAQAREKAAEDAASAARSQGLTSEQAGVIRAKILGIKVDDGNG